MSAGDVRVWFAQESDFAFCLQLCRRYRDHEFFYVPDASLRYAIQLGQIVCFDYRALEAGYVWVTFPRNGRCRINQLAVDEQLWRHKVGTTVTAFIEQEVRARGGWAVYLSCNSNTPGHNFWPMVGYTPIVEKPAGRRGGANLVWAKVVGADEMLFVPPVSTVKSADSYRFQSSITESKRTRARAQQVAPQLGFAFDEGQPSCARSEVTTPREGKSNELLV